MFDNYCKEEVTQALDRLAADVNAKSQLTSQTEFLPAERKTLTGQGSDCQNPVNEE